MASTITNVVFDIGNVLIEWNPENLYRKLIPNDDERHEFLTTVCTPDWNVQQDLGRTWTEAVEVLSREFPEKTALIRAYADRWHEMVPGPVPGTEVLLSELKANKTPLYAITNFSSEKFVEAQDRFPFLKTSFLDIVVSAEERMLKPDVRIYQILIDRNDLAPERCLFIDDSLPNVDAARQLGMIGHHFKDAAGLERELTAHNLIVR
ncbi:HAD family hydrolase [Roseibium sp.]|uniref:HAD family hydrolase n=1 Tax=Roseibium sp. TaxID=1936156 RepID=UPI003D115D34